MDLTADEENVPTGMVDRYVAASRVPRPIQLGPRRIGWLESELAAAQQGWRKCRSERPDINIIASNLKWLVQMLAIRPHSRDRRRNPKKD